MSQEQGRVWVAIREDGSWYACGWNGADDGSGKACVVDWAMEQQPRMPFAVRFFDIAPQVPTDQPLVLPSCELDEPEEDDDYSYEAPDRELDDVTDDEILGCLDAPRQIGSLTKLLNIGWNGKELDDRLSQSSKFVKRGSWWWRADKAPLLVAPKNALAKDWYRDQAKDIIEKHGPMRTTDLAKHGIPIAYMGSLLGESGQFYKDENELWNVKSTTITETVTVSRTVERTIQGSERAGESDVGIADSARLKNLRQAQQRMNAKRLASSRDLMNGLKQLEQLQESHNAN